MRRMPSATVRFAVEAAFLALVALGAGLARLDPFAIVGLMAVALIVVALVERAYAREAARAAGRPGAAGPVAEPFQQVDVVDAHPEAEPVRDAGEAVEQPEPELAVSERSARAILATSPPPVPEPAARGTTDPVPEPEPEHEPEPGVEPELEPEPEPEPSYGGPPREWSLWDLERLVREHAGDRRQEEWAALILSLREFARADGMLPVDFDDLVRESFGGLLETAGAAREAAAAP